MRAVSRAGEFEEDEAPLRGVPFRDETHHREQPLFFATPAFADPQEFIENEPPVSGLSVFRDRYDFSTFQVDQLRRLAHP